MQSSEMELLIRKSAELHKDVDGTVAQTLSMPGS